MSWFEGVITGLVLLFFLFLTAGCIYCQHWRYWERVWEKLGRPDVRSIGELKKLQKAKK